MIFVEWAFTDVELEPTKKVTSQWDELKQCDDNTLVKVMDSDPNYSCRKTAEQILKGRMERQRNL